MGSNIAPLLTPFQVPARLPKGEVVAIDGHNAVVQAMTKNIRGRSVGLWRDREWQPVAHLQGILNRATSILAAGAWPLFVFDGKPAEAKGRKDYDKIQAFAAMEAKIAKARKENDEQYREWLQDRPSYFWPSVFRDVKKLLSLLGCPYIQAPSEGEAQAAFLNLAGIAYGVISQDFDALLFGAPLLYRRAPGPKATYVVIRAAEVLKSLGLNRNQLIDVAILAGSDFAPGVQGVGPRIAAKLLRDYECIEGIPRSLGEKYGVQALLHATIEQARATFLNPAVAEDIPFPAWRDPSRAALLQFCCKEHHLNETRIIQAMDRWAGKLRRSPKQAKV
jgi:flap endonuclease-1